jgi:predicted SnoaL-like aldol condensation-catalyzing enzyme
VFHIKKILAAATLTAICGATLVGTASAGVAENKKSAVAFLDLIFQEKIDEAFDKYVSTHYVNHNPKFPDGVEGTKGKYKQMMAKEDRSKPATTFEAIKVVGEGDYVVVHGRVHPSDRPDASLMDWFKFDKGKIVEQWQVIEEAPPTPANNNTMFGK